MLKKTVHIMHEWKIFVVLNSKLPHFRKKGIHEITAISVYQYIIVTELHVKL